MINPDNIIRSSGSRPIKGNDKSADKPSGVADQAKFKEVYGVYERKKTKEELDEDWENVKNKGAKGERKSPSDGKASTPVSLFDLAKERHNEEGDSSLAKDEEAPLFADKLPPKKGAKSSGSLFDLAKETALEPADFSNATLAAQVQSQQAPSKVAPIQAVEKGEAPQPPQRADALRLQKIIDEIVEHVYQLETKGEKATVIVIGDPKSVFKGASIRISEMDSSRGQLNITIDNLRPEAKALIERHEAILLDALERKGYQVQQFVATSALENPRFEIGKGEEGGQQEGRGQGQQGREQRGRGGSQTDEEEAS